MSDSDTRWHKRYGRQSESITSSGSLDSEFFAESLGCSWSSAGSGSGTDDTEDLAGELTRHVLDPPHNFFIGKDKDKDKDKDKGKDKDKAKKRGKGNGMEPVHLKVQLLEEQTMIHLMQAYHLRVASAADPLLPGQTVCGLNHSSRWGEMTSTVEQQSKRRQSKEPLGCELTLDDILLTATTDELMGVDGRIVAATYPRRGSLEKAKYVYEASQIAEAKFSAWRSALDRQKFVTVELVGNGRYLVKLDSAKITDSGHCEFEKNSTAVPSVVEYIMAKVPNFPKGNFYEFVKAMALAPPAWQVVAQMCVDQSRNEIMQVENMIDRLTDSSVVVDFRNQLVAEATVRAMKTIPDAIDAISRKLVPLLLEAKSPEAYSLAFLAACENLKGICAPGIYDEGNCAPGIYDEDNGGEGNCGEGNGDEGNCGEGKLLNKNAMLRLKGLRLIFLAQESLCLREKFAIAAFLDHADFLQRHLNNLGILTTDIWPDNNVFENRHRFPLRAMVSLWLIDTLPSPPEDPIAAKADAKALAERIEKLGETDKQQSKEQSKEQSKQMEIVVV